MQGGKGIGEENAGGESLTGNAAVTIRCLREQLERANSEVNDDYTAVGEVEQCSVDMNIVIHCHGWASL